jgi:hypothetical protein
VITHVITVVITTGVKTMSNEIRENPSRISFPPRDLDAERLSEVADELGYDSRAAFIRETLRDAVTEHAEADPDHSLVTPDNDTLADAYDRLLALSDVPGGSRRVPVAEAEGELWTQSVPKEAVQSRLLEPLQERGFVDVANAQIRVRRRTREQVERADAAEERLAAAGTDFAGKTIPEERQQLLKYQRAEGVAVPQRLTRWAIAELLWSQEATA